MKNNAQSCVTLPRIAALGPRGTFSEKAVVEKWKDKCQIVYADTIQEIFEFVEVGKVDHGIVPIEDSMEGDVQITFDLLRDFDLHVTGELQTEVTHCLLAKNGIEKLEEIGSHPQALLHCRKYLDLYLPKEKYHRIQTTSTAAAAKLASTNEKIGAIADERVAKIYGLKVLRRELHDYGSNTTRFFQLSKEPIRPEGNVKTFIMVYPQVNRPGVLTSILEQISKRNFNLTHIASRPYRRMLGEYIIFANFDGQQKLEDAEEAVEAISKLSEVFAVKNFGSYPYEMKLEKEEKEDKHMTPPVELSKNTFGFWENKDDAAYDKLLSAG